MGNWEHTHTKIQTGILLHKKINSYLIVFKIPAQRLRPHVSYDFDLFTIKKGQKSYGFIAIEYSEIVKYRKLGVLWNSQSAINSYFAVVKKRSEEQTGFYYWGGTVGKKLWTILHPQLPWYYASFGKTETRKNNFQDILSLYSNAKKLEFEVNFIKNNKIQLNEEDNELLKKLNPSFFAYEKINTSKIFYQRVIASYSPEKYKLPIVTINPFILKDMCLLTGKIEEIPKFIYYFTYTETYLQ